MFSFRSMNGNGTQEINICLEGEEMSDALNFVLKDEACGAWYDDNGSNFKVALKPEAPTAQEHVQDVASIPQVSLPTESHLGVFVLANMKHHCALTLMANFR